MGTGAGNRGLDCGRGEHEVNIVILDRERNIAVVSLQAILLKLLLQAAIFCTPSTVDDRVCVVESNVGALVNGDTTSHVRRYRRKCCYVRGDVVSRVRARAGPARRRESGHQNAHVRPMPLLRALPYFCIIIVKDLARCLDISCRVRPVDL